MGDRRKLLTHIKNVLYLSIVLICVNNFLRSPIQKVIFKYSFNHLAYDVDGREDVEDAKDGICLTERSGHRLEA